MISAIIWCIIHEDILKSWDLEKSSFEIHAKVFLIPDDENSSENSNFWISFNEKVYLIKKIYHHNDRIILEQKIQSKNNWKGSALTVYGMTRYLLNISDKFVRNHWFCLELCLEWWDLSFDI